eukprot:CAMPEP_0170247552 /NCGR_PEP_ID=MMETSP0116_2-20130129/23565_1 /TAXON_ID=400756 /ORGANISM="Durinskia baltica, Strain CSIRO CS-38" /LENGTH=296 /DNA_ID=CAMNT_0010498433 /DNA_START=75 /DNA_END=965 /DNA_ORIENTATION=-
MARSSTLRRALLAAALVACAAGEADTSRAVDLSMASDDECTAGGERDCSLSALQRRAKVQAEEGRFAQEGDEDVAAEPDAVGGEAPAREAAAPAAEAPAEAAAPAAAEATTTPVASRDVTMLGCQGPWCTTINEFNALFDTNDPPKMQQAIDKYSEWPSDKMGIKVGVTKDHFYEMYHGNVKNKLQEYLPQGMFAWTFGDHYQVFQEPSAANGQEVVVVRDGTITFALGWVRRGMFWNAVVQPLGAGMTFPHSKLENFDDCDNCSAEMIYTLKKGGLDGSEGERWVIVGLAVVKMA